MSLLSFQSSDIPSFLLSSRVITWVILNFQKETDSPQLINREIESVKFFSVQGIKRHVLKTVVFWWFCYLHIWTKAINIWKLQGSCHSNRKHEETSLLMTSNRKRIFCEVSLKCVNLREKRKKFYFSCISLHDCGTDYIAAREKKCIK